MKGVNWNNRLQRVLGNCHTRHDQYDEQGQRTLFDRLVNSANPNIDLPYSEFFQLVFNIYFVLNSYFPSN